MAAFIRSICIILCILMLGVTVSTLPANIDTRQLATPSKGSDVVQQIEDLQSDIELLMGTMGAYNPILSASMHRVYQTPAKVTVVTDLPVFIEMLVTKVGTCTAAIHLIGSNVDIDPSIKLDLAFKITAIVTALTNLSIKLVNNFGVRLVGDFLANIDTSVLILNRSANGALSSIPNV
ncbi:hypothetical protein OPQ81_007364 [Rhizoctonia solani]|nr:hypothetical protein OPQ81_007364 [Rhizoctonia solani]